MRTRNRVAVGLWALLAGLTATAAVDPNDVGFAPERLELLDRVVEQAIADAQVAGAVVLIRRRGEVAWLKAYGEADIASGRPMRTDDIFRIASMTKAITSAAVLMLYEEGHFQLNDPVGEHLPAFDRPFEVVEPTDDGYRLVPAKGSITIHHLLTHTSGISYRFMNVEPLTSMYAEAGIDDGLAGKDISLEEIVNRLATMPLLHEPGERWTYGMNTDVLGRLVEVVSGKPLAEFLDERLFEPLGMHETWFEVPDGAQERLASVHRPAHAGGLEVVPTGVIEDGPTRYSATYPYDGLNAYPSGGAGLSSTAEDYGRFLQMLLNDGELDGVRVLSRKTVELMTANQTEHLAPRQFSLGFDIERGPASGRIVTEGTLSWGGFFNTTMWFDPEEELAAVLMTQHYPYGIALLETFPVLVYQAIDD